MFRKLRITCVLGKEMEVEGGGVGKGTSRCISA